VERVIMRAMELERAKRFATAADMHAALQIARQTHPTETSAGTVTLSLTPPLVQPRKSARRKRFVVAGIIFVVLVAAAVMVANLNNRVPLPVATHTSIAQPDLKIMLLSGTTTPEYLVIQNSGDMPQDMSGWYLESTVGQQVFNFPAGFTLAAGDSVRIESFTGAINNPPQSLLWSIDAIWRNAGDKAILRNQAGAAVSTACYGDACP